MIGVRTTVSSHKHLPSVVVKKSRHPFRDRCLPCFSSISFPNDLAKVNIIFGLVDKIHDGTRINIS